MTALRPFAETGGPRRSSEVLGGPRRSWPSCRQDLELEEEKRQAILLQLTSACWDWTGTEGAVCRDGGEHGRTMGGEVLLALLARDAAAVARLTTRGRWALRGLLRGGFLWLFHACQGAWKGRE